MDNQKYRPKYRDGLPQLNGKLFLTDGGIETTMIFKEGFELPHFAAFYLLRNQQGRDALENWFHDFAALAHKRDAGFVLESATWRANSDWAKQLGYTEFELEDANHQAIEMLEKIRVQYETENSPMVISGCVGPRGDGYDADKQMTDLEAQDYHQTQINAFSRSNADMITATTMTYAEEAIGVARAAQQVNMPVAISFTVRADGKLPSAIPLKNAIREVDEATNFTPAYYMINCAHPTHFVEVLEPGSDWTKRIKGLRASASCKSHAEVDAMKELDEGNSREFASQYRLLKNLHPHFNVLGGCCGTDYKHVEEVCKAILH